MHAYMYFLLMKVFPKDATRLVCMYVCMCVCCVDEQTAKDITWLVCVCVCVV